MSKDTKAILERRNALIKELSEEPQLRTRTGVKAGATVRFVIPFIIPIMCLSIAPDIIPMEPDPTPW